MIVTHISIGSPLEEKLAIPAPSWWTAGLLPRVPRGMTKPV